MTAFRFRAARPDGEMVAGVLEAATSAAAADELAERGLFPVELREREREEAAPQRARYGELAPAFAGLAALLEAGLPLDRALAAAEESAAPELKSVFADARGRIREGSSLSSALAASREVPEIVRGLLRAGEAHGRLAAAVRRVADELEREAQLRSDIRAALAYPTFLLVVGGLSVALIVGVVVPRFAALLGDLGQTMPAATRLVLGVSALLQERGLVLIAAATALAAITARVLATEAGRVALHRHLLALPVLGPIRHALASARVCHVLGGLLDTGVPLLSALDLSREASADRAVAERLTATRRDVSEGSRLAVALKRHAALSPQALRLVAFGEESGRLAALFRQAGRLEAAAAQRALRSLVALIEPLLIVGFGAVVALVAAALLQAVYSVRPAGF
jgi:general secretion pathway protein F